MQAAITMQMGPRMAMPITRVIMIELLSDDADFLPTMMAPTHYLPLAHCLLNSNGDALCLPLAPKTDARIWHSGTRPA